MVGQEAKLPFQGLSLRLGVEHVEPQAVVFPSDKILRENCSLASRFPYRTADIFRGIMVSLYVKGKENGHVQAYAPTGAMVLK